MTVDQMRIILCENATTSDANVQLAYDLYRESLRNHVGADAGPDVYDTLDRLAAAAQRAVRNEVGWDVPAGDLNRPVIDTAASLLVGLWFANREAVAVGTQKAELPLSVTWLLMPIKKWVC
nr:head-tail connector protein [Sphingomonas sp. CARO-RG-8B-R24-01]